MAKVSLYNASSGDAIESSDLFSGFGPVKSESLAINTVDVSRLHGTFKSVTRADAGTTVITSPDDNGSLFVTDILISGEKQAGSTVEIRFTDDTENVTLFLASQVDAPPNVGISFVGRVQGWKDARLDLITSGAGDATVLVCYTKIPTGLDYSEWDSYR